jgi:hypothetical protein
MAWSDALDEKPEPERQTGLDWIRTISEADQSKIDRRVAKARRKLDRAERKHQRKMRGHDHD